MEMKEMESIHYSGLTEGAWSQSVHPRGVLIVDLGDIMGRRNKF
jgi:hypothetical protein